MTGEGRIPAKARAGCATDGLQEEIISSGRARSARHLTQQPCLQIRFIYGSRELRNRDRTRIPHYQPKSLENKQVVDWSSSFRNYMIDGGRPLTPLDRILSVIACQPRRVDVLRLGGKIKRAF